MTNAGNTIIKNVSVMLAAQSITWALGFVWAIYLPSYIGDTNMGKYAIATSIWAIMAWFINTGTTTHLTKEIARSPDQAGVLFGTILLQRYLIFLLTCVAVAIYTHFMNYAPDTIILIWIVALTQPFWHTAASINAIFQGFEVMQYTSLIDIISKLLLVGLSFIMMFLRFGIIEIASVAIFVSAFGNVMQFLLLRRLMKIRLTWSNQIALDVLRKSVPYFLSGLVMTFYFEIDKLIMSVLVEERVLGWYSVAMTLTGTFLFLPSILTTAVFPALARDTGDSRAEAVNLLRKSFDITFLMGVPIGFGLVSIANPLILFIYGPTFAQSGPILTVMGLSLIFTYLATLLGRFIVATDRTNLWTTVIFIAAVLTLPLDLLFIPWCQQMFGNGAIGGAISYVCTELLMVIVGVLILPRGALNWGNVSTAVRTVVAGTVMMIACWFVRDMFIAVPILVGMVVYLGMVAILRILPPDDVAVLWSTLCKAAAKLRVRRSSAVSVSEV